MNIVVSKNHNILSVSIKKISLPPFKSKGYILDKNVINCLWNMQFCLKSCLFQTRLAVYLKSTDSFKKV